VTAGAKRATLCDQQRANRRLGETMIGPPGLPKYPRRVFSFASSDRARYRLRMWQLATAFYTAGVLAHFSHYMTFEPPLGEALISAPVSLVWPADLIRVLIS
jgi:hypothetical protein